MFFLKLKSAIYIQITTVGRQYSHSFC